MIWFFVEHPVTSIFMFFSKISGRMIRHFQGRLHMVHLQSTFSDSITRNFGTKAKFYSRLL